jgi:hypothetical protein
MDSEHKHKEIIQRDLQVLGQEAMPEVPEREPDIRSGTTSPQSLHREAEDRGGADHGLRGRDGPGDKMFQLQRLRTYRQELSAETEVPQMRQGRPQNQRVQSRKIGMRELQADRAQSLRQEVPHNEEGTRVKDRPNRVVLNAQGLRDRIKVFQANLGRGREATELLQRMAEEGSRKTLGVWPSGSSPQKEEGRGRSGEPSKTARETGPEPGKRPRWPSSGNTSRWTTQKQTHRTTGPQGRQKPDGTKRGRERSRFRNWRRRSKRDQRRRLRASTGFQQRGGGGDTCSRH